MRKSLLPRGYLPGHIQNNEKIIGKCGRITGSRQPPFDLALSFCLALGAFDSFVRSVVALRVSAAFVHPAEITKAFHLCTGVIG